ncbi:MAG: hypothetical protein FIA97_11970 [Methylococcaceae bacterium]|nr:hypothetical protein [Methylococcaceae bacterium]
MNLKHPAQVAVKSLETDTHFPNSRYFQVHFEHLYELINELKAQLIAANHQIAQLQKQQTEENQPQKSSSPVSGLAPTMLKQQPARAKRRS